MTARETQSLTDVERRGLNSTLSLADGHAAQELDSVYESIIRRLPEIWLDDTHYGHRALEREFLESSALLYASPALARIPDFKILPTASLSIDVVSAAAATRRHRVGLIQPTFDNIAQLLQRRQVNICAVDDAMLLRAVRTDRLEELLGPLELNYLFVVNPNNPTGRVLSASDLTAIARYCKRRHMTLVLDNSFRLFKRNQIDDYQILLDTGISFIAIEDTGKVFPTQEKKASLLTCSADLAPLIDEIFHEIYLSTCGPDLRMLSEFLKRTAAYGPETLLWRTVDDRRARLRQALAGTPLRTDRDAVHSSLSVEWLDCSGMGLQDVQLCERLQARGLTILPGRQFFWSQRDDPAHCHNVRVSLMKPRAVFEAGVRLLAEAARCGLEG